MVVVVVVSAVAGAADNDAPVVDVDENAVLINCVFPPFCIFFFAPEKFKNDCPFSRQIFPG